MAKQTEEVNKLDEVIPTAPVPEVDTKLEGNRAEVMVIDDVSTVGYSQVVEPPTEGYPEPVIGYTNEIKVTPKLKVGLGETVLYTAGGDDSELYGRTLAGIVVNYYEDSDTYNLVVFTPWGTQTARMNVPFLKANDPQPDHSFFGLKP